jgi:hypothetical protein
MSMGPAARLDIEFDVRVRHQEAQPDRRTDGCRAEHGRINAEPPSGMVALLAEVLQGAGDLVHSGAQPLEQAQPGIRQRHAACRALQQANVEALLELPHGVTERRRRHAQALGSGAKAPVIGNGDERGQVGKVTAAHS